MMDLKDAPFLAIGLAFAVDGIWTEDAHFRRQTLLKVYSTKELWLIIKNDAS
jgi:predicted nucleic acid-binding protein